jgi:hypothetical protein
VARNWKMKGLLGTAVVVLALAFAPAALAQNSSQDVYGPQGNQALGVGTGGGPDEPGTTSSSGGSSLPFTGLDVSLLAGGGLLLLLIGVGMAVAVPRHRQSSSSSS